MKNVRKNKLSLIKNEKSNMEMENRKADNSIGKLFRNTILLTAAMVLGSIGISNAQLSQGDIMLGSDLGSGLITSTSNGLFGFNFGLNDGAGYNVGLSPKIGYFVNDNFLIGALVNLGFTKSPEVEVVSVINGVSEVSYVSSKSTVYGIQAFARYYLFPGQIGVDNLLNKGRWFFEANAGISGVNVKDGNSTNGIALGFGPGYSYFITDNVALETSLKYNGLAGGGNTNYINSIGLNLGIQIFLPASSAENIIENEN